MNITIMNTSKILYKGHAESVIFPGDTGVFEVMLFHKRMMCRLLKGSIDVDGRPFPIERGIVKIEHNDIMALVE